MKKQKILIIEDETISVLNIRNMLENKGYIVCDNGVSAEDAIHLTKKHNPDLILMDIILDGGKDGIFAVAEIKKKHDIPIVYCTANTNEQTLKRAKETEPHGYIIKPISREELLSAVEIALYRHDMERKLKESQKKLSSLLRNIPGMVYMAYPDWSIEIINNSITICGYSAKELNELENNWLDIIHVDDRDYVLKEVSMLTGEEKEIIQVYRITAKDGSTRWVEDRKTSLFSDTGEFMWIDGIVFDITERKNSEIILKESELKFKDLAEKSLAGIYIIQDDLLKYVNPRHAEIFGYTAEEMIGIINPLDRVYHEDRQFVEKNIIKREKGNEKSRNFTFRGVTKKKDIIHVEIFGSRTLYEGKPAVIGTLLDITEHKKIEEALYKSESRFRDISTSMADWIWEVDKNGIFTFVSGKVKEILGYEPHELIGQTPFDIMTHDEAVRNRKIFAGIAAAKKPIHDLENWNVTKDGKVVCLLTNGVPILDENGELAGYRGVDRDITDSKKAVETLQESVEMYRTITENATDIIWEMELDGNITFISPSSSRILGFKSETDVLTNMKDILTPDSYKTAVETIKNELRRVKKNRQKNRDVGEKISKPIILELEYVRKDGSTFPGEITTSFIRDIKGNPVKIAGIIRDISERKKSDEQIKASLKEKEILLKEIHHRVKNNMNIIISIIELEKMNISTSNAGQILDDIKTRIMTISLIHEKLYKSKDIKYIEIAESIKSLTEDIFNIYNPDPGRITLNLDAERTLLTIDRAIPLGLLLNELLTNIFKYAFPEDHAGPCKISISLNNNDNSTITLTIKDNGIGLSEGFDIKKADSLGLTLVDALTIQLKGKLKITGKRGTKVTVTFPGEK